MIASELIPWRVLLLAVLCLVSGSAQAADPAAQQIRACYVQLDAAYSQRDIPAITAFLAPSFVRTKWNTALTSAQFQAALKDDFDGMDTATARTQIQSLTVHGDSADAVAERRLDYTFPKPLPEQPPPYFEITVTDDHWQEVNGHWLIIKMQDTPLFETLCLLNERDQKIRFQEIAEPKDRALDIQMGQDDAADRARLKQIIQQYGWPSYDLVGTEGNLIAWEIVQHSDNDKAFQRCSLPLIAAAVKRGQSNPSNYAYLTDRILCGEHKPQIYGTQIAGKRDPKGNFVPAPLVDPAHVDERRAAVGLAPLAEYLEQYAQIYTLKPKQ